MKTTYRLDAKPKILIVLEEACEATTEKFPGVLTLIRRIVNQFEPQFQVVFSGPEILGEFQGLRVERPSLEDFAAAFVHGSYATAEKLADLLPTRWLGKDPSPRALRDQKRRWVYRDPRLFDLLEKECGGSVGLAEYVQEVKLRSMDVITRESLAGVLENPPLGKRRAALVSDDPVDLFLWGDLFEQLGFERHGRVLRVDLESLTRHRSQFLLYEGEEFNRLAISPLKPCSGKQRDGVGRDKVDAPLVSIVVPVYDRSFEILRLAHSVASQKYPRLEVVFVTNGSPVFTLDFVREAQTLLRSNRIQVMQIDFKEGWGCATRPRDVGAYAARGEFIMFLDTDDYLESDYFDGFLSPAPDRNCVYMPSKVFRNYGRTFREAVPEGVESRPQQSFFSSAEFHAELMRLKNFVGNSGVLIPKDLYDRIGGIDHRLRYCEDYYLWLRAAHQGASLKVFRGPVVITLHKTNNEIRVGDGSWHEPAEQWSARERVV